MFPLLRDEYSDIPREIELFDGLRNFKGYDSRLMERVAEFEAKLGISDTTPANSISD